MDKEIFLKQLHEHCEELFTASLIVEKDSKEQMLLYFACQLGEIAIELIEG